MSSAPPPQGTVTFLFSDIEGSTDLVRRVGQEAFATIRADHRRLLRAAFAEHGGREIDTAGDGFFVAFDSARSAVSAAVSAQLALAEFDWHADVRVRMGLHTAEPHLGEDGYVGVGVHRASRICDAARGGQILVSNATAGIIEDLEPAGVELRDLGEHRLKGLPRDQRLFQLTVLALPSTFGPPRTADAEARTPGVGTFASFDLAGWRRAIRTLGDEASAELMTEYHDIVSAAVETNEGVTLERVGDNVFAVFRDAGDAVRAAEAVRESLLDFAWPPDCAVAVKAVLHSGRWSGDPSRPAAGSAFAKLYAVSQVAEPGQIVMSQATAALLEGDQRMPPLRNLGEHALTADEEPVRLYEVAAS